MPTSLHALLGTRRFAPLLAVQFLGAFNDNLFKTALVLMITYGIGAGSEGNEPILVTAAAGLFVLPFFLFSATSGQLADRLEKAGLVRWVKAAEVAIMAVAAVGLVTGAVELLMVVLFLMGTQSAVFGPVKYGILPELLREDELVAGNGLVEAGTFLAILFGTIAAGMLSSPAPDPLWISVGVLAVALTGWACSLFVPRGAPAAPELRINPNFVAETAAILRHAASSRAIFLSILGISWFWFVGATFLAQFPTYAKQVLGGGADTVTLMLVVFSVGIAIGSLLCNRALKGEVSARYVPLGAIGITFFNIDLSVASWPLAAEPNAQIVGIGALLAQPAIWRVLFDLFGIALCGGFYIVPLYAIIQARAEPDHRSRTIAANNVMNAAFMVASAAATMAMLGLGFDVAAVFLAVALGNAVVALYICKLLPDEVLRALLRAAFRLAYRTEVRGFENLRLAGDRAVIVANHTSFLDGLLLAAFLPETPHFAINTWIAQRWWVRPLLRLGNVLPVDPGNPMAMKTLAKAARDGRKIVIFPEGRITVTGALMKIYEGPGMVADLAGAPIVPVRIDGAQYTPFSRLKGKVRLRWFPKIAMTMLPPERFTPSAELRGRARRRVLGEKLYDVMSLMMFETSDSDRTLFRTLIDARAVHGRGARVVEDVSRVQLGYGRLLTGAFALGRVLTGLSERGERVGVLLPNANATAVTLFALGAYGRVPAMLNFSTGLGAMLSALRAAETRTVLTSRAFVERAGLQQTVDGLAGEARVVFLEDLRTRIGPVTKLAALLMSWLPALSYRFTGGRAAPDDPAVVLFTSGSEGAPKGVVLSHRNIVANINQLAARIDFSPADVVFNALPMFHSFGLTGGFLLPVLSGVRTVLYPSPLHYRIVPALVYDTNATAMFGTDTFLAGYARSAHPYDFYSVRYVFAGAEKLKDETRRAWHEKFGIRILEGYGATETAPVLSMNTPMHHRTGSVGRLLPAIEHRLTPVPGIEDGGRLEVRGPNVMLGYLRADAPGVIDPPPDGWYDTGDIVDIDADGFVTIKGRAKRFAKIAGEMVSLNAVEALVAQQWPDAAHAVVALPDARKGEQLVLVTEQPDASRDALLARAKAEGVPELMVPRAVLPVDQVPLLGTGKTDYPTATRLAAERAA